MTFEYIVEPEQSKHILDDIAAEGLARRIAQDYETYNQARHTNLAMAEIISNEVFFENNTPTEKKEFASTATSRKKKEDAWKSNIKMCKTYMFYQTFKAFIWKNIYANINSMFDVSGENQETDNDSNKQKAMLVDVLEKMDFQKTCDKIIDYSLIYGELISFAAWKKKYIEYRRPIDYFKALFQERLEQLPKIMEAIKSGKNYYIDEKKIYDNPYIYPVNPANFVFDVSQKDDWDNCPKIYRSFKTPSDILNNKYYTINNEDRETIKGLVSEADSSTLRNQDDRYLKDEVVNGGTIEVLDHWGDLRLSNGTVLRNWHAVVVGRKFLVKFERNERILNPFTFGTLIEDPKTKRGISHLYSIIELAKKQEELMNRTCNLQALAENPPILSPKDFFKDKENKLYPGKIIEYDEGISPQSSFKPLEFNVGAYSSDISFLSDMMSEISGIFPNMVGQREERVKTATEISTKAQGQVTRLAMVIDTINQYLIIPVVKNVAKLCADFKFGTEKIYINKDNKKETIDITDEIRQGDYKYTYSDRTLTADRIEKTNTVAAISEKFAKYIPLNAEELFTYIMEQNEIENPERFLQQGVKLPQEIQNVLAERPEVQAMLAGYQQRKQEEAKQQGQVI